jgi:hypothetical protein
MSGLTKAQVTISHAHLRGSACPICGNKKTPYMPFCKGCYFALPDDLRPGLWIERTDINAISEFAEKYFIAKDWLRRTRISKRSQAA